VLQLSSFTVAIPAAVVLLQISKLLFVDLPGAERLGMDAEVLRLREGLSLNKSLLGLGLVLRRLAQVRELERDLIWLLWGS
jgi:hypothetical protein